MYGVPRWGGNQDDIGPKGPRKDMAPPGRHTV
jgi:hypothetical protein